MGTKYDVGIDIIDQQHQHLIGIINQLHSAVFVKRVDEKVIPGIISELLNFAVEHFRTEEKLQADAHYPGLAIHRQQHKDFFIAASDLGKKSKLGTVDIGPALDFIKGWFIEHSQGSDKLFVNYLQKIKSDELVRAQLMESSRLASLGEMAAGIAHEINNPLSAILGRASKLQEKLKAGEIDGEYLDESLSKITSTATRIAEIIKGLQTVSRSDEHAPITKNLIRTIVDQTLMFCGERFRTHDISLTVSGNPACVEALCHPVQLSQVILNLLNNAFDAIKPLSERWVRITLEQGAQTISIRVTDSGQGIPEDVVAKIMDPFFTTKPVGQGTGLGLSISKGLIEKSGGKIFYDGSSGNTSFVIVLPLDLNHTAKKKRARFSPSPLHYFHSI